MSNLAVIKEGLLEPRGAAQLKMALPAHITPEKFQRAAITALMNNPDIADCSKQSVMNSLMKCAQDGLIPDGREAAIVKFKGTAQYLPMAYGLIKRMRNSGEVQSVNAYIVYDNEDFDWVIRDGVEEFTHKPMIRGEKGGVLLAYAVVLLKDGGKHVEVMRKADIEKARLASPNQKGSERPLHIWASWYEEMAKKTVIHRAAKRCPTSSDIERMLQRDMRVTLNGDAGEDEAPPAQKSLVDGLNAAIEAEIVGTQEPPAQTETAKAACENCGGAGNLKGFDSEGVEYIEPCPDCQPARN